MAETAKRLRTAGDASTESAGKDGARAAVEPTGGAAAMPEELRAKIEHALEALGEVEFHRRLHRKGPGPVHPRCVPAEDLVHEKVETLHKGDKNRVHYRCSNPKCADPIRYDKWDAHVLKACLTAGGRRQGRIVLGLRMGHSSNFPGAWGYQPPSERRPRGLVPDPP